VAGRGVTQDFAIGRSATVVKLLVSSQDHKITLHMFNKVLLSSSSHFAEIAMIFISQLLIAHTKKLYYVTDAGAYWEKQRSQV